MQNKTENKKEKGFIQHQISFFKKNKFGAGFTRTLNLLKLFFASKKKKLFKLKHETSYKNLVSGFTLIELMVVISIIALLSSIVLVSVGNVKNKAREAKVKTEIHEIKLALEEYNTQYGGYPNPGTGMYCIGSTSCMLAGQAVSTQLTGPDIALNKNISNLASSFPVFSEVTVLDENNQGYIYVGCNAPAGTYCPSDETDPNNHTNIIYPKPTTNTIVFMPVGTFLETTCNGSVCTNNSNQNNCACADPMNCGAYDSSCETYSCGPGTQSCETNNCGYGTQPCIDPMNCAPGILPCETYTCGETGTGACYDGVYNIDPTNCGSNASPCYPGGFGNPNNCGQGSNSCYPGGTDPMNCGPGTSACYNGMSNIDPMNCAPGHSACYNENNPNPNNCSCS